MILIKFVSFFMHPRDSHMTVIKRILRYLRYTAQFGRCLWSDPSTVLATFSDVD
jgi:hypothetical protein